MEEPLITDISSKVFFMCLAAGTGDGASCPSKQSGESCSKKGGMGCSKRPACASSAETSGSTQGILTYLARSRGASSVVTYSMGVPITKEALDFAVADEARILWNLTHLWDINVQDSKLYARLYYRVRSFSTCLLYGCFSSVLRVVGQASGESCFCTMPANTVAAVFVVDGDIEIRSGASSWKVKVGHSFLFLLSSSWSVHAGGHADIYIAMSPIGVLRTATNKIIQDHSKVAARLFGAMTSYGIEHKRDVLHGTVLKRSKTEPKLSPCKPDPQAKHGASCPASPADGASRPDLKNSGASCSTKDGGASCSTKDGGASCPAMPGGGASCTAEEDSGASGITEADGVGASCPVAQGGASCSSVRKTVFPWHPDRVLHRFLFCASDPEESVAAQWKQAIVSFSVDCLTYLWVYRSVDAERVFDGESCHLVVRDASAVMPWDEFNSWMAKKLPIPIVKDMFSLRCLHMFGGWFADLDIMRLRGSWPTVDADGDGCDVALSLEYERTVGAFVKGDMKSFQFEGIPVSVNLGFVYASAKAEFLAQAEKRMRDYWNSCQIKFGADARKRKEYGYNQHLIQQLGRKCPRVKFLHPRVVQPFPRWLPNWNTLDTKASTVRYGTQVETVEQIESTSFACCIWAGPWAPENTEALRDWAIKTHHASEWPWTHGGNCGKPNGDSCWKVEDMLALHRWRERLGHAITGHGTSMQESGVDVALSCRVTSSALMQVANCKPRRLELLSQLSDITTAAAVFVQAACKLENSDFPGKFGGASCAIDELRRKLYQGVTTPKGESAVFFCDKLFVNLACV